MVIANTLNIVSRFLKRTTLEQVLVFLLGLSIFLSNTGIYAVSALLTLYFIARLATDQQYRLFFLNNKTAICSLILYLLGLVVTIAYPGYLEDISWYARKAAGLLILPPLLYAFQNQKTRQWAISSLFIGFWLASIYTLQQAGWQWDGGRVAGGTWLVDIWSVLLAMFVAFMVPLAFGNDLGKRRYFYVITVLAAITLLIMSGGRGPWLGAFLAVFLYMLLYQRHRLLYVLVILALLYIPIHFWGGTSVDWTVKRAESITDLDDKGNWIRMTLWKLSLCHSFDTAQKEQLKFLLGQGPLSYESALMSFYNDTECLSTETKNRLHPFPSNDTHNMYLDSLAKMGAIWTPLTLLFIVTFAFYRSHRSHRYRCFNQSAQGVVIVFLVVGVFYSIMLHWTTFMLIFLISLATHEGDDNTENLPEKN